MSRASTDEFQRREASATGAADAAQALALSALVVLLEDPGRTSRFLGLTGLDGAGLAERVHDPAFLAGVLDFVLDDEGLLVMVASAAGVRPDRIARLRRSLPGSAGAG